MDRGEVRRDELLRFIVNYRNKHGFSPSVGEMAGELMTSKSNVHHHLIVLKEEGLLDYSDGRARSWVPTSV